MKSMLSSRDAADMLGLDISSFHYNAKISGLRFLKDGNAKLYFADDIHVIRELRQRAGMTYAPAFRAQAYLGLRYHDKGENNAV